MEKAMRNETKEMNKTVANGASNLKDMGREAMDRAKEEINKSGAAGLASGLFSDAKDFIEKQAPEYIRDGISTAQTSAKRALTLSEQAMRRNVWYSVLGAAGVGIVLGAYLFSGRKKSA